MGNDLRVLGVMAVTISRAKQQTEETMPHSIWITIAIFNAVMFSIAAPLLFTALAIVK
jgi:hypothetical protein